MKKSLLIILMSISLLGQSQVSPAVSSWLQNTTETGFYYPKGNPTLVANSILVNCQKVEYSADFVYVTATGIPSYPTGPFSDGNPSQATNQNGIYKIPLNPTANTGTLMTTTGGNVGIFINGVALFDYRDGVAWDPITGALCGGPGNPRCSGGVGATQDWNRDAIPAEKEGFDCAKGHPAMGNYHHHQNPSAFKLDLNTTSEICNLYDAEGLYAIDNNRHSPLIGYAYDGFPIYGAYGYAKKDGTGDLVRIKSGYSLRSITTRATKPDGSTSDAGPSVDGTYFLGYFREDYEFKSNADEAYLDEHNGRFCVTPEYPEGTYAYFCTVDENWNSAYPYAIGPTFFGISENRKVTTVSETTTVYTPSTNSISRLKANDITLYPNPATDLIAIQLNGLNTSNVTIRLIDIMGKEISQTTVRPGSTIAYYDVQAVYEGTYILEFTDGNATFSKKVVITR